MRLTLPVFAKVGEFSKRYSNLPEKFIERKMEQVYWKTPRGKPQYLPRTQKRERFLFTLDRPWTKEFFMANAPRKEHMVVHVEPIKKWSFFLGDLVEVLVGPDQGKQGIVKYIVQERNWILVDGLNTKLKCFGKEKKFPGVYMRREQPLLVTTQVKLVDPSDLQPTEIEWRFSESGEEVRVSSRTGRVIPIPNAHYETVDYKLPHLYKEQPKDTTAKEVGQITFEPALKTFEMDIMDKMGIKEDRVPKKVYWY